MTAAHDELATWDAAYVLGALTPADRRTFEDHLESCDRCRAAVAELASLPGLLARAEPLMQPAGSPPPPVDLVEAIIRREARRVRTVRTRMALGVAGAAAAVALALAVPAALSDGPEPAATVELAAVASSPLTATVELTPVAWGTRLSMTCAYPEQDPQYGGGAGDYVLVVTDDAGEASQVSTWSAVPGKEIALDAATAVPLARIASVEIRTAAGDTVLTAAVAE